MLVLDEQQSEAAGAANAAQPSLMSVGGPGPSPLQRMLLRLLAAGMTDEAAATRLGVSPRTVRRYVADLMEALSATSRFQVGVLAARNGWLTGDEFRSTQPAPEPAASRGTA